MTQTTFDDIDESGIKDEAKKKHLGPRRSVSKYQMLADNAQPFDDLSCPWCCAPASEFDCGNDLDYRPACSNCSAVIPVEQEWYLQGDKIGA